MKTAKRLAVACFFMAVCIGSASAQEFIIKKRRIAVIVKQDSRCPHGISVSGGVLEYRQLCADFPEGIAEQLRKLVGSIVELEAMWTFLPDPGSSVPVALGTVSAIRPESTSLPTDSTAAMSSSAPTMPNRLSPAASVRSGSPDHR